MRTNSRYYSEADHSTLQPEDNRWSLTAQKPDGSHWAIGEDEIDEEAPTLTRQVEGPAKPLEIGLDTAAQAKAKAARAAAAFEDLEADIADAEVTPEAAALIFNRIAAELKAALGI
jgi:hypothetical protein